MKPVYKKDVFGEVTDTGDSFSNKRIAWRVYHCPAFAKKGDEIVLETGTATTYLVACTELAKAMQTHTGRK